MNIYSSQHAPKSQLPSLALVIAAHLGMLWLAMQAVHVIQREEKRETTYVPAEVIEPIKRIEPEVKVSKELPPPTQSFFPPPEVFVNTTEPSPVKGVTQVAPPTREYIPTDGGTGGTGTTVVPHTPVHTAAVVDARACDKPEYPPRSLALGEEGVVYLAMLIGPEGQVLESRIEKSSGSKALDRAAVAGLSLCKFKPGTVDGVAEKSWAKLQYAWTIN